MAAMMMLAAACTSESGGDGDGRAESCAYRVLYQDRTYRDVANVEFTAGRKLGPATVPLCEDTGDQDKAEEPGETTTAYAVDGISPDVAVAVGDSPGDAALVAVYSGDKLPPEIQELIDGS
ncbi:DUF6281 family protein [Streptomyces uncialis]|uniref:DUF6281 family protein n=1 Tax=Streptomyces uncialis TaxID=1048205 RepID=UPI0037F614F0